MKAQEIYHNMRAIAEPIHAYSDQMVAIAKWIEAEFEYKPQKLVNGAEKSTEPALHIPVVSVSFCEWCRTELKQPYAIQNNTKLCLKCANLSQDER